MILVYLLLGTLFGLVLTKGELASWWRMQEMFRMQGIYMYGVFATALLVATPSFWLIRRLRARSLGGEAIELPRKEMGKGIRYVAGGAIFGVGWALVGVCPGPIFATLAPTGGAMLVGLASAVAGAWVYGFLRPRLPH